MAKKFIHDKGEITVDRMTGLAFRDGKVLGRKNWIVPVSYTHLTLPTIYSV